MKIGKHSFLRRVVAICSCTAVISTVQVCGIPGRPSSEPFVSGDTFRAHCKFIVDEEATTIRPEQVEAGDIIFVAKPHLDRFFSVYHPNIRQPYILLTHNGVEPSPGKFETHLKDRTLYEWFTSNIDREENAKLHAIPLGLENAHWGRNYVEYLTELANHIGKERKYTYLLYANLNVGTFPSERLHVRDLFINCDFCFFENKRLAVRDYLERILGAQFTLSPRGYGLDCHRTWEALSLGCVPIVRSSTLNPLYRDLPIIVIDDWRQVTRKFLESEYERIRRCTYKMEKLTFSYWWNIILQYQVKCRTSAIS